MKKIKVKIMLINVTLKPGVFASLKVFAGGGWNVTKQNSMYTDG